MLIIKKNEKYFCFIDNPKCGSSTMRDIIYKQLINKYKVIFKQDKQGLSKDGIPSRKEYQANTRDQFYNNKELFNKMKRKYNHEQYTHCSLEGAVKYLKKINVNVSNVIFITTIRNPIIKLQSTYHYNLKREQKLFNYKLNYFKYKNFIRDFEEYLDDFHLNQFIPERWRIYQDYKINYFIKLENIREDLQMLGEKYALEINLSNLKRIRLNAWEPCYLLPKYILKKIRNEWKLDFIDGNYEIPDSYLNK